MNAGHSHSATQQTISQSIRTLSYYTPSEQKNQEANIKRTANEVFVSFHIIASTFFVRYANLSCKRMLSIFERVKMRMTGQNAKGM